MQKLWEVEKVVDDVVVLLTTSEDNWDISKFKALESGKLWYSLCGGVRDCRN